MVVRPFIPLRALELLLILPVHHYQ
jgi:hypothetical protein